MINTIKKENTMETKQEDKPKYTPPECKELGSVTKLTQAKTPGAADGKKSKL
jgi:hypothetical protein